MSVPDQIGIQALQSMEIGDDRAAPGWLMDYMGDQDSACQTMDGLLQFTDAGSHQSAVEVFKSGRGRDRQEHSEMCFCGVDLFFHPGCVAKLVESWLPSLNGVVEKLTTGAKVADIGCGHGSSSILMAKSFPNSQITGYDFHQASIDVACEKLADSGLSNIHFEVGAAKEFSDGGFDLICIFDALHDTGDPVAAARHIRRALKPDGTFMIVEPLAGGSLAESTNLLSGILYSFSAGGSVPASGSQELALQLGAQARLTEVLNEAGFRNVRRATETDANIVLEATR